MVLLVWVDPSDFFWTCSCVWGQLEVWLVVGSSKAVSVTFLTVDTLLASGTAAAGPHVSFIISRFSWAYDSCRIPRTAREWKHQCLSIFWVCITFVIVSLARAYHMAKLRTTIGGDYPRAYWREEFVVIFVVYLSILRQFIYIVWYIFTYYHF